MSDDGGQARHAVDAFRQRDPVLMTSHLSSAPSAVLSRLRCSNAEIARGRRVGAFRGRA